VEADSADDEATGLLDDVVVPPQHPTAGVQRLADLPTM